jgi:DNA polymerase gamma 1
MPARIATDTRLNPLGVQMLPRSLHKQLFPRDPIPNPQELIKLSKLHLEQHSLLGFSVNPLKNINFPLPKLTAPLLDDHFRVLGLEQQQVHAQLAETLAQGKLPPRPTKWQRHEGWTKYNADGSHERIDVS